MEQQQQFPTEEVTLPSKGLVYPESSPLSKGVIKMKYMTAKEEDILTNQNFIEKGTVIDKLLQSLIVTPIDYNELITGDKNAILVAARILGYGKDYKFKSFSTETNQVEEFEVDLTKLKDKHLNPKDLKEEGVNEFDFTLPTSKTNITFKILTHGDEKKIDREIKGLQKIKKDSNPEISTRLKYIITSIDGDRESKTIREFVDNYLLAKDSRALRTRMNEIAPDIDLKYISGDDGQEDINIPISLTFFWPDAGV